MMEMSKNSSSHRRMRNPPRIRRTIGLGIPPLFSPSWIGGGSDQDIVSDVRRPFVCVEWPVVDVVCFDALDASSEQWYR
jgi:hypothetical protein